VFQHPRNVWKTFSERYLIQNWWYPYVGLFQQDGKPIKRLTDRKEILNYLKLVYQHPWNVSKKSRKISHLELEISLYLSKSVRKGANYQINRHTSIPTSQEFLPKKLRKTFHPELEISLYLYKFSKEVSKQAVWQTYKKFRIMWN